MKNVQITTNLDLPTPELQEQVTTQLEAFIISLREVIPSTEDYSISFYIQNYTVTPQP